MSDCSNQVCVNRRGVLGLVGFGMAAAVAAPGLGSTVAIAAPATAFVAGGEGVGAEEGRRARCARVNSRLGVCP